MPVLILAIKMFFVNILSLSDQHAYKQVGERILQHISG